MQGSACRSARWPDPRPASSARRAGRGCALARCPAESEGVLAWINRPGDIWQCTTCMACVELPAGIADAGDRRHASRARRAVVMWIRCCSGRSRNIATQGNSFGKSRRDDALAGPGDSTSRSRTPPRGAGRVHLVRRRLRLVRRATAGRVASAHQDLHDADISGLRTAVQQQAQGDEQRQVGEQGLFEMLVSDVSAFADAQFHGDLHHRSPFAQHAAQRLSALRLDKPVYHHTELLADSVAKGVLTLGSALEGTRVTYHDPCYLARYRHHGRAARADRRDQRARARSRCRATAPTRSAAAQHADLDRGVGHRRTRRASSASARRRPSAASTTSSSAVRKDLTMYTAAALTVGGVNLRGRRAHGAARTLNRSRTAAVSPGEGVGVSASGNGIPSSSLLGAHLERERVDTLDVAEARRRSPRPPPVARMVGEARERVDRDRRSQCGEAFRELEGRGNRRAGRGPAGRSVVGCPP